MRYELLVGLRYTRAKRRNHFISFISLISMAGIALGVAALIVVLSVMNGFQKELRTRILGVASHVQISGVSNRLADWPAVAKSAAEHPRVIGTAPFVNAQGLLSFGQNVRGSVVRGVIPEMEDKVAEIGSHMRTGRLDALRAGEFGIVLGAELARSLGVLTGEKLVLITPQGQVTPAGVVPRLKQFTVVGIFEVGMFEYDSGLALIHLEDAQRLFQMSDTVSGVRLKLDDLYAARTVGALIGIIGTALGVCGGTLLALNIDVVVPALERMFSVRFLSKDVYYISDLPSDLQSADVIVICAVSLLISFLATLYPSWRASRVNPAEALRYE